MVKVGSKIDEVRIDGKLKLLRQDLDHFAGLGLEAVELPVHGLDAIVHGRLNRARVNEIKSILRDFDFTYSIHAPNPLNLMDRRYGALHFHVFRASMEFASEIGSGILVYHAGRFVPEEDFSIPGYSEFTEGERESLLDGEASALRDLADEFPDVFICVENARPYLYHSPYCYAEYPGKLKEQVSRIARPNVRVNLDTGHLFMAARYYDFDPIEAAEELRDFIAHSHVHDNFGHAIYHNEKQQTHLVPFGRGDAHMPVGWGEIPLKPMIETFLDAYSGMMIMELRSRYFEFTGDSMIHLREILGQATRKDRESLGEVQAAPCL